MGSGEWGVGVTPIACSQAWKRRLGEGWAEELGGAAASKDSQDGLLCCPDSPLEDAGPHSGEDEGHLSGTCC